MVDMKTLGDSLLRVLHIEPDPTARDVCSALFAKFDINTTSVPSVLAAQELIQATNVGTLRIDAVVTELLLDQGTRGVEFINWLRNLPDDLKTVGCMRVRFTPVVVCSAWPSESLIEEVRRIDKDIQFIWKPFRPRELVSVIDEVVRRYESALLSELQSMGLAVVWQNGGYRVFAAFRRYAYQDIEGHLFSGSPDKIAGEYSRLVLVSGRKELAVLSIEQFEELLNRSGVKEHDFQRFFESHPEFLLRNEYDSYWPEPVLTSPKGKSIRPDFILQPRGLRSLPWRWGLVDLKRSDVPVLRRNRHRADFSSHVYRVISQLRDYSDFFGDSNNFPAIESRFGGALPVPQLCAIIGRLPDCQFDRYAVLQNRIGDVTIATYDEVLELRKAQVDMW